MSEFAVPDISNNFTRARLLANITDSSIALQVHTNQASDGSINAINQFEVDKVAFYNDVVVADKSSELYNETRILEYIEDGILSDITVLPAPSSVSIAGFSGSSHTIKNNTKIVQKNKEDHLEIAYSVDLNNTLKILVYRDIDGLSYSLDNGNSCIKIGNVGLVYPSEITSIAVQNFTFEPNLGNLKIWIGTIREGIKSYTIGATSWITETNLEKTGTATTDTFLFRESLANTTGIVESDAVSYDYVPGNYAPCYILGIVNNPTAAGLPIIVHVKNKIQPLLTPFIPANYPSPEVLGTAGDMQLFPIYLYKYLTTESPSYTLDTTYNVYRISTDILSTSWISLPAPTTSEIFDVLKSVPYNSNNLFTSITPNIVTAVSVYSTVENKYVVELLKITAICHVGTSARSVTITKDSSIGSSVIIDTNRFSGLSTYKFNIFITERSTIWRYVNSISTWEAWLIADDILDERNTRISPDYKFTVVGSTSFISGFKGFGILETSTYNVFLGILNTDLGHLSITLTGTTEDFMVPIVNSKKLRHDLFSGSCKDFQIIPEQNMLVACGLSIEPVIEYKISNSVFNDPIRYSIYNPITISKLPDKLKGDIIVKGYKNYTHGADTNSLLHNKYNAYTITSFNTDQLYFRIMDDVFIPVLKSLIGPIQYNDLTTFDYLDYTLPIDSGLTLSTLRYKNYLNSTIKYNRLKFLFRATESINFNNSTLESDYEIPFVPEIEYQIL